MAVRVSNPQKKAMRQSKLTSLFPLQRIFSLFFLPCLFQRKYSIKCGKKRGAWVAQLVKRLTLDFGSGHDLAVCEFEPRVGLRADSSEPGACFRFCVFPLSLPFP